MKITAVEKNAEKYAAMSVPLNSFSPDVRMEMGSITDFPGEAWVSPANSFGYMDGGIDLLYSQLAPGIQEKVQAEIQTSCKFGELLVGDALIVPTDELFPDKIYFDYLVVAPTMRIPSKVPTFHSYLATRAAVSAAKNFGISHLVIPGMATGHGGVPPKEAAWAMRRGIKDGLVDGFKQQLSPAWKGVAARHIKIGSPE